MYSELKNSSCCSRPRENESTKEEQKTIDELTKHIGNKDNNKKRSNTYIKDHQNRAYFLYIYI